MKYSIEIANDKFYIPRHARLEVDLEIEELLDKIEVLFVLSRKTNFSARGVKLEDIC